ncbi:MAG: GIY-YIG nuclease family protein [Candidatus Margulisbacteria bacterium]|nr:GIY-YIG nuclease family protein [Candidatus Margulisiibacteriota bacterium]
MDRFYVYVLQSLSYNTYYIGSTGNVERRLREHNSGKGRYTSGRVPWRLVYKEEYPSRREAIKRESALKSGQWRKILKNGLLTVSVER